MWPFLISADDHVRDRKYGNYAGDKSRMHLPSPTRQQRLSRVWGANCHAIFAKQNPTNARSSNLLRSNRNQPASFSSGWSFSNLVMFSIVVTAMFNKASRVKKAW